MFFIRCRRSDSSIFVDKWNLTAATITRSFLQRPQAAIRELRAWPRIHVQPRFQWGFRNGVTFLRVVYILSCDQAALWMVFSVRLSVCPSVTPFWVCSHHRIIMKFSEVITKDQGKVHAKVKGQRSKVKVTEVTAQFFRFRTVTPVWIHIWWWNDTYSLMLLRQSALLFFKVIRQISRSHGAKNHRIWPRLGVSGL